MPFKQGRVKTGGRISGTPNKHSSELKAFYEDFLLMNKDKLQECFEKLVKEHPDKAVAMFLNISKFVTPQLKSVEVEKDTEERDNVIIIREYKKV